MSDQRSRRIAFARRVAGPIWSRLGLVSELEVPGRRTGKPMRVTLYPVVVDGTTYLLSQYGITDWVRNLRAAGGGHLRRKGRSESFTATEVDGAERERVIAAFRGMTPKSFTADFDLLPSAAEHPTFRVEPAH